MQKKIEQNPYFLLSKQKQKQTNKNTFMWTKYLNVKAGIKKQGQISNPEVVSIPPSIKHCTESAMQDNLPEKLFKL